MNLACPFKNSGQVTALQTKQRHIKRLKLSFLWGWEKKNKVYKNKEVTDGGNSVQVLSPGTKICVCKRIYIQAIMYA